MPIHKSGEDYLETILLLTQKSPFVRSIDVAHELGYTKPSVSRAVGLLKADGFITVGTDGHISLTEKGKERANEVYSKHCTLENFFEKVLKVSHETAEEDACKIEHLISEETYQKLQQFLKNYNG